MRPIIHLLLTGLILLMAAFNSVAEDKKNFLIMKLANCEKTVSFLLEDNPEIKFTGDFLSIIYNGNNGTTETDTRNFCDVENFHFELRTNALHSLKLQDELEVKWVDADNLMIRGAIKNIMPIQIYDMSGTQKQCEYDTVSDDVCIIGLESLRTGIYIITFNNLSSIKIIKK